MRRLLSLLLPKASSSTTTPTPQQLFSYINCVQQRTYRAAMPLSKAPPTVSSPFSMFCMQRFNMLKCNHFLLKQLQAARYVTNASLELMTDNDVVRFSIIGNPLDRNTNASSSSTKGKKKTYYRRTNKMSRKDKLNELRFFRLKAKKKMRSPNPEVRIRYKLEKAKRKESWLIEKLRKFEICKAPSETYDPEILTEEERFYLKRTGEKKKNYVPVGRRGVFGGVVLNMHLHWKRHETVKVICKACKLGQVDTYAEELARLSKGIVIDIKPNNTILFYRGKNYVQPEVMSPPETLSKNRALERYQFEQSLEHTSQFIEKLEEELDEYHKHIAQYRKDKKGWMQDSMMNT